jgi:hypothetical protein
VRRSNSTFCMPRASRFECMSSHTRNSVDLRMRGQIR